uniref:Uncharacterized protein n=1 Tax=Aegilops tauschii subsp. strangulata TaxID=200361 RepID=A0A453T703_AEGTS
MRCSDGTFFTICLLGRVNARQPKLPFDEILGCVDSGCALTRSQDIAWLLQLIIWRALLPLYCTSYI